MPSKFLKRTSALLLSLAFATTVQAQSNPDLVAAKVGNIEPQKVQKVLSAGKVSDVLLISLAPEKLLGFSKGLKPDTLAYLPENLQKLPTTGKLAGRDSTASLEKVMALKPDLILDVGTVSKVYVETAERVHQQTNIPFLLIDGDFADSAQQIRTVAKYLGNESKGTKLASYAETVLNLTHNALKEGEVSPSVYFARGNDGLETGLANSIHSEVLNWVGLKNVADMKAQKSTARVSMEQLFTWQPDYIITQDKNAYDTMLSSPVWQQLNAVKNHHVYLVPSEPFGWLGQPPSVNRLLGALWLTHTLAPQKLDAKLYSQWVKSYFTLFYGKELSAEMAEKFHLQ